MPSDVFLSFTGIKEEMDDPNTDPNRRPVTRLARNLLSRLRQITGDETLNLFWFTGDKNRILAGSDWEERLRSELKSARVLIILLSPTWLKSEWCRFEYENYLNFHTPARPVIPVIWDEIKEFVKLNDQERTIYQDLKKKQKFDGTNFKFNDWPDSASIVVHELAEDIARHLFANDGYA